MPKLEVVNANNVIEFNPQKANFKLKNTGGPKGDTGAQGPRGPKGETGAQGPAGASASVTVGSTTTLSPGADATVTNSGDTRNAILNFGIPTGARGPKGDTGSKGDTGPIGPKGAKGDTGAAATVQVGNTNTGAPGTNAQVTNAGNEHFAVFNFTIPRGDKGEKGATGAQGPKGPAGQDGTDGFSPIATVTQEGLDAEISITDKNGTTTATVPGFGVQTVTTLPATGTENIIYLKRTEATATGKSISISDAVNAPLASFQLDGETSQNGTPTPDAPIPVQTVTGENVVRICGKNLLDVENNLKASDGGLNFSYSNDKLVVSGTPTRPYANVTNEINTFLAAGQYTLSLSEAVSHRVYIWVRYTDGAAASLGIINAGGTSTTTTFAKDVAQIRLDFAVITTGVALSESFSVQLEKGSSSSSFEPYQGQSYEINLGKNLLDMATLVPGYVNGSNGSITSFQTMGEMCSGFIKVEPSSTYTVSIAETTSTYAPWFGIGEYTAADTSAFIRRQANTSTPTSYTITTHSTTQYVRVSGRNFADATKIQFEKWPSPTDYAAYFTPIELCKIGTYQDYIYKSGGKWYVHKEVEKAQISVSAMSTNYSNVAYALVPKPGDSINRGNYGNYEVFSERAKYRFRLQSESWNSTDFINYIFPNGDQNQFLVGFTAETTLDQARAVLNDSWLYYALATPTDTEITNEALVAQLEAILSQGKTYAGTNNITTVIAAGNEQGELTIGYYNAYDSYLYVAGRWQQFARLTAANE